MRSTKREPAMGVDAVREALEAGAGEAALTAALAWWRDCRAPAVADLVDAISQQVSGPPATDERAFARIASAHDPLDLGPLLAAIPQLPASFLPAAAELIVGFPVDPRVAGAVAAWAADPITTSSSTYPFWTKMFAALIGTRDVRAVPVLRRRLRQAPGKSQFWPKFHAALERAIGKLEADPPDDVAVPAALGKRVANLAPVRPRDLAPIAPAPSATGPLLAQALAQLAAGRSVAAIDAMLARWRQDRVPELADLIDRATRLLPTHDVPLVATTAKQWEQVWLGAFQRDPMAAMPQLLQYINVGGPRLADRRLVELGNLADDPRIALRFTRLATELGASSERTQYWKALLGQITRIADVRTCEPLRIGFDGFTNDHLDHHRQARRLVAPFALNPPAIAPLPADDRARLVELAAALEAAEQRSPERALIAAIAEAWDDDGPRRVYADWLLEREHPRGELIVLECNLDRSTAEEDRRRQLEDLPFLFGAIDDFARTELANRDRGIPYQLDAPWSASTLGWRALASDPLVALIETIDVGQIQRPPTADDLGKLLRAATRLHALRRIEEDQPRRLWAFADAAAPGFHRADGNLVRD